MSNPIDHLIEDQIVADPEFARLQLSQAIETFRTQFNLVIQILTVFVTADVVVIGFAIADQLSGILLIGALIPLMMIIVIRGSSSFMLPVLYTAISIESDYGGEREDWLASTFVSAAMSYDFVKRLQRISRIELADNRIEELKKLKLTMINRRGFIFLLLGVSLLHIAASVFLTIVFGWRFL